MNSLYSIKNLQCSYNQKDTVLKINRLEIPQKSISVLLGVSGAGKSTILEALGLMNNTILSGEMVFHPNNGHKALDIKEAWTNSEVSLANIRNEFFSFIFQNTNLMPNFTALENVCITQMIQGKSFKESAQHAQEVMDQIGLTGIDHNKKVTELSGGQQQRLAFVRAITPEFSVLFGDEPTGNLDDHNSRELMRIIRERIITENKSAIIVSHNIDLAAEYADFIMLIDKPNGISYGQITPETIFTRTADAQWTDHRSNIVPDFRDYIKQQLFNNKSHG